MFDEKFNKIIIYLKVSCNYITKRRYSDLVKYILDNLNKLGVEKGYLNEIEEILKIKKQKKGERDFIGKECNRNYEDNPIFNKYFELYLELSELCDKKNAKINLKYWNDFIQALETS